MTNFNLISFLYTDLFFSTQVAIRQKFGFNDMFSYDYVLYWPVELQIRREISYPINIAIILRFND